MCVYTIKSFAIGVFRRMKYSKKQYCVDCHFFVKEDRSRTPPWSSAISLENRKKTRIDDFSWKRDSEAIGCAYGVWDEGHDFERSKRHEILVGTNRKNFCFFWKYQKGMFVPAAKILQEREAAQRKARRDRILTIVGLWIAAIALAVNTFIEVWDSCKGP